MPIWLIIVSQNIDTTNPKNPIIKLDDFKFNLLGIKFINEYWEGIKFETKLVDKEATIIKSKAIIVMVKLSNFPIISFGLVKIEFRSKNFKLRKTSDPITIKTEKKEKTIKFKIKDKLPFLSSFSFLTYREKSPKLTNIIEKYANTVPEIVIKGQILFLSIKFL